jgi:transcriptional regulator with XRE-family HTH domain
MSTTRQTRQGRARPIDVDRYIGARMRERRVELGMTQHQMAELIGCTYQQAHKYEKGINRISGGRLYHIAQALGVEVGYFFEGFERDRDVAHFPATANQRLVLEMSQIFVRLERPLQMAVLALARALVPNGDESSGAA